jgi:hypothetical protein
MNPIATQEIARYKVSERRSQANIRRVRRERGKGKARRLFQ